MTAKSISETKQVRYLLGLSSPAERERIELDYFEDDDAFQEMLAVQDDLIDAYARGELEGEERRSFEERFVSSLRGRDRVQFARAFASAVSTNQSAKTKIKETLLDISKTLRAPGLLQRATIGAVIVLVAVFAWLVIDRRSMTNELRKMRAESAELSKRTEPLQRSSDNERTRTAENAAQLADLRLQPDKPKHRERTTSETQRATVDGVSVESFNASSLTPGNASSSGGSTVRGTATDANGKIVSGAIITLTDTARNFTRTQSTNEDGAYVFNAVPPGTYSLEVKAPGFKTALTSGLSTLVDTPTVRDVQLEVGAVSETIGVTSAAKPVVNTNDATLGNSFEQQRITELPLNVNNVVGLLSLQPGVGRTGFVNGGRADQLNLTLDGVDVATPIPSFLSWIRFQIPLEKVAIHDDYRVTIKAADGRSVTSVDWIEPVTPNQTMIDTPAIASGDLPPGDYVLVLLGKEPNGSFIKLAEYSFKVMKY